MKGDRSSGRGGDSLREKNGVLALLVGVRNRQDYFKTEQCPDLLIVLTGWISLKHMEDGKTEKLYQWRELLFSLIGMEME